MKTSPSTKVPASSGSPLPAPLVSEPVSSHPIPVVVIEARSGWKLFDWREIVQYRDLLYFLVLRDVTVLYKQTVLGFAWAIINPFFSMVVLSVIFGKLLNVGTDGIPQPVFYFSGTLLWTYFSNALTLATGSLITGTGMFTKVYFPRVFIPLVPIFSKLADFAIAFIILIALMIYCKVVPSGNIVYVPVLMLLMMATAAGLGMFLSALAVQYRDVRHAMNFAVTILMYAAPVTWPISKLHDKVPQAYQAYLVWYGLYPMAGVIAGFRAALLNTGPMPWGLIGMGAVSATLCFVIGALYFRRTERVFADVA
jgi:lipopolysaccharide transport system permease protein